MAIQLKYSANTSTPTSLANGEPAFASNGDVLFIGSNSAVIAIAGKRFPGTLTANQAITIDANSFIDEIKAGGLTITTSGVSNTKIVGLTANIAQLANSTTIASASAVKNYVDENAVSGGSTQLNGLSDVTITDGAAGDFLIFSNTSHVRNITAAGGLTATANDTHVSFDCTNAVTNFTVGANLQVTTALKDGSGNRLQILYANGDAAWG